jgi:hypothetical protein
VEAGDAVAIKATWKGVEHVTAAFASMAARTGATTGATVTKVLHQVERQERTQLSLGWHPFGTKTGSVPPSPPWRISGHLSRSVRVEPAVSSGFVWTGRVGPTAVYARIQELGGRIGAGHRTVLPSRPHLRPAWAIVRPTLRHTFTDVWAHSTRP